MTDTTDQGAPGTAMTSIKELIGRQDQGTPVIKTVSMRIRPTDHRDIEDPGAETTSTEADLIVRQDPTLQVRLLLVPYAQYVAVGESSKSMSGSSLSCWSGWC